MDRKGNDRTMIAKFGTVTITEDEMTISGFTFDGSDGAYEFISPEDEVLYWIQKRVADTKNRKLPIRVYHD